MKRPSSFFLLSLFSSFLLFSPLVYHRPSSFTLPTSSLSSPHLSLLFASAAKTPLKPSSFHQSKAFLSSQDQTHRPLPSSDQPSPPPSPSSQPDPRNDQGSPGSSGGDETPSSPSPLPSPRQAGESGTEKKAPEAEKEGEVKTCSGPVHEQACTLELSAGDKGLFDCSNPLPSANIQDGVYSWEGVIQPLSAIIPGAAVEAIGSYTLSIPSTYTQKECFSITCSAVDTKPTQQAKGNPTREEALQLIRYTLLVRVNGGRPECLDEPDLTG